MAQLGVAEVARAVAGRQHARAGQTGSRAAVALILRDAGAGAELLFIHRAEHPGDPWSGQMGFPGGRAEPGDEGLLDTAIRETREETGIDLARSGRVLGRLDEVRAMARGRPVDLAISPFVFALHEAVEARPDPREVRDLLWIGLQTLLGEELRSTLEFRHEGHTLELPCFRLNGRVIWGLSYRMFEDLEQRLTSPPRPDSRD